MNILETNPYIYDVIPDSKNMIMTLVNSINSDETFQKHVNKLSESEKPQEQKKAQLINTTIQKIKVFNTNVNPLFLAKDIGILMGISQINYLIKKFEQEEKVTGYITKNNKIKKVIFLTRHGIYRCFFASRSPLARLFRKFICNLIDHMIENEAEIIEKLSAKFQIENAELIEKGMGDLQIKLIDLETKYLEEQQKALSLEIQCEEEHKKRMDIEEENVEIDTINTFNIMHIEQLKKDKIECMNQIKTIRDNVISEDAESIDVIELRLLKEKFMKPLYIYILHPTYLKKLLKSKQKELTTPENITLSDDSDNNADANTMTNTSIVSINVINNLIADTTYDNNFTNIFVKDEIYIEPDEILYFYFGFGRNTAKQDKIILVNTQWIANKKHYLNILKSLHENCNTLFLQKIQLYNTSLDEICDIIREEFINL
jgi:prophage antirepressor-like protein